MSKSEQFYQGQEAARNGAVDDDCPYPIDSDEAMDWYDGLTSEDLED